MGTIAIPQAGQPIDIKLLTEITNEVNSLSRALVNEQFTNSKIDNGVDAPKDIKTRSLKFYAFTKKNVASGTKKAGDVTQWSAPLDFQFKPVAVVTPVIANANNSSVPGSAISVVITDLQNSSISGLIYHHKDGQVSIDLNILVMGIKQ